MLPAVDLAVFDDRDLLIRFLVASLFLGIVVSWLATVLWNRAARVLPVSLAGQLVVFETLSSLIHAFLTDRRWPEPIEVASAGLILTGVVVGIRATTRPARAAVA